MKRHLLLVLTLAILLPSLAILVAAGVGIVEHERAVRVVARSYVQDLAEMVASRLDLRWGCVGFPGQGYPDRQTLDSSREFLFRFFSWRLSMPGWVAVIDGAGQILTASPGAESLAQIVPGGVPVGRAIDIKDIRGRKYTVAAYPVRETGWFVVAAVAWEELLGPMIRYGSLWAFMIGGFAVAGLAAVWALWKWLIAPLRALENEVSGIRWGEDLPAAEGGASVFELQRLRRVLRQLAQTAIEKAQMMRRSVTDMVRVQEQERTRLARDIHDGPLQGITALIQQLRLADMTAGPEDRKRRLTLAGEGAQMAVRELRGLCDELSPPWLDLGLSQALTELAERLAAHLDVEIAVECDHAAEALSPEGVLALFRVVQEAVHNAVRHGRAQRVEIRGFREGHRFVLEVEDDGGGFEPERDFNALRVRGHRGLANMQERMALVGGTLELRSAFGKGTVARCLVPLGEG